MTQKSYMLQLLYQRFQAMLPWFSSMTRTRVTLSKLSSRCFTLTATWAGGSYAKEYDAAAVQAIGRGGCPKKLADDFVQVTLSLRRS